MVKFHTPQSDNPETDFIGVFSLCLLGYGIYLIVWYSQNKDNTTNNASEKLISNLGFGITMIVLSVISLLSVGLGLKFKKEYLVRSSLFITYINCIICATILILNNTKYK
jgi:hypothetical protein